MSMPRTSYQGAFSEPTSSGSGGATTKLVGSAVEEEELYCRQAAGRLAAKLQRVAVICSCSFRGTDAPPAAAGMDPALLQHRAAALAEKRVYEILKDLQAKGEL